MTSFTRKLYLTNPQAADDFHRAQQFEHRLTYGKHVTLACFEPSQIGTAPQPFGKRARPPVLPAYQCFVPDDVWVTLQQAASDEVSLSRKQPGKAVVRATSSFEARKEYAAHYGLGVFDVCARLIGNERVR
jgi:hypothetical protein